MQSFPEKELLFDSTTGSNTPIADFIARELNASQDKSSQERAALFESFRRRWPELSNYSYLKFNGKALEGLTLTGFDLTGCEFTDCTSLTLTNCNAPLTNFSNCRISHLFNVNLTDSTLRNCDLSGTDIHTTLFSQSRMENSNCRGTKFHSCNFSNAIFANIEFDSKTQIRQATSTKKWTIDRYSIACLDTNESGLTTGNRMDMNIEDDVAKLRQQFSGISGLVQAISVAVFISPYAWFIVSHWIEAEFTEPNQNNITLLEALARYYLNAGRDWRKGFFPHPVAVISTTILIYNCARLWLLWKTNRLETTQRTTDVPAHFSMHENVNILGSKTIQFALWWWVYWVNLIGFYVNLSLVAIKTVYLLQVRITVDG